MSQIAEWFAPSLLRTSLTLIVAALLVATCVKWLRLRSPAGEQWAWLLVLVQGVMFASLTIPVPSEWLPQLRTPTTPLENIELPAELPVQGTRPLKLDVPERSFDRRSRPIEVFVEAETAIDAAEVVPVALGSEPSLRERLPAWPTLLCAVWLLGIAAVLLTGLLRYRAFVRELRQGRPADAEWSDEWNRLRAAVGVRSSIPLLVADDLGPALCRVPGGYRLVVPEQMWQSLTTEERCAIYRHELEHYRRGDLWWMLGVRLLASVHWFNPCAWWAARKYEAQSEFACDTAAAGDDPAQFSKLLVQLASGRSQRIAGVQSVAAGSVYERVQRLLMGRTASTHWHSGVTVAAAVLAIGVAGVRLEAVESSAASVPDQPAEANVSRETADEGAAETLQAAADPAEAKSEDTEATPAVAPPTDVAADEIAGVVVDISGKPVADALVDVWHWVPGNETRTDEHGVFRIPGIDGRERAEVRITKEGYTPAYFPQQQLGAKGWVVLLTDTTYIEGTVTGADGQPAVGAEIRAAYGPVEGDGFQITEVMTLGQVGVDGKYRLYLKPDTYDIQIAAPGQGVKRLTGVVVAPDEATPLSVTLERGVRFEARVVDSESGQPVEGFILWQWRPPHLFGRSDKDGKIVFEDLVPGATEFSCGGGDAIQNGGMTYYQHGPFGRWWSEQANNEWQRKQIDDPRTGWQRNFDDLTFDLTLDMEPVEVVVELGVAVSGRVTDPDGNPVAGATVAPAKTGSGNSLTGDTRYSEKTKEDGTYSVVLPASNAAQYNLMVHDGEYSEWRTWANGVREPMQTKPGQVIENYDLQLTRPAVIRGQVTFAGKPVANREVRTHSFEKLENRYYDPTTTTDAEGNFELKFVRAGKHYLQVEPFYLSAEQAPKGSREIEVEAGQVLEGQDLIAPPLNNEPSPSLANITLQARVIDPNGKPVSGASVGIGLLGGAPSNLASLYAHFAKVAPNFTPPALEATNADGLLYLATEAMVQSRQNVGWIYAVDSAGKRAGAVLLNLDDYATADPAVTQVIDVAVAPLEETIIRFNLDAIPPQARSESGQVMMVDITRDGMRFQRMLAKDEDVSLLLPQGEYQIETSDWYAQRMQSTWKVAGTETTRVDLSLQPSRLGSLIGQPAPEFSQLKPGEAANPTLAELKGQVVILDFWGHWCGPCVASMPNLMQLYGEFKDRGVSIIGVHDDSVESYTALQPILERLQNDQWKGQAIPFPVVLDGGGESAVEGSEFKVNGATTASYGILSWPTTLAIDRSGRVAGLISAHDVDGARKRLEELLAEPAP